MVLNGVTLNSFTDYGVSNAGVTTGVEAMSYPLVLVGAGNYTGQRAALWKIDKAVGTMIPNVPTIDYSANSTTATTNIEIQWSGTGILSNITATSSNNSIVGVYTNGMEITIDPKLPGNATINVSCDKNNISASDASISVSIPNQLSEFSWEGINIISKAGKASEFFNIGDEITFTTKDDKEITMQIVGFNHDDLSDGSGKAGITFGMKNLYYSTYTMNSYDTNSGEWEECEMRTSTMQEMFNNLPDELQSVIKLVNKKTTVGGGSTSITTSQDKLWLYSQVELDGTAYIDGGTQYEYWQSHNTNSDRIKKLNNGTGSANIYWLRSPAARGSTGFRGIASDGYVNGDYDASYLHGLCFCFCI